MDVGNAKFRFGGVVSVKAEALGQPGQRRFRLVVRAQEATATVWLEKEQLRQLALLVQELLESTEASPAPPAVPMPETHVPPGDSAVEFRAGKMALGHDTTRDAVLVLLHDVRERRDDAQPILSFWLRRPQAEALATEAIAVVEAGRPRCALCGGPIDPQGHMCPKANGHGKLEGIV